MRFRIGRRYFWFKPFSEFSKFGMFYDNIMGPGPKCRCCGKTDGVLSWPSEDPDLTICPYCCYQTEDGHDYEREGGEWFCTHCGEPPSNRWLDDYYADSV